MSISIGNLSFKSTEEYLKTPFALFGLPHGISFAREANTSGPAEPEGGLAAARDESVEALKENPFEANVPGGANN